MTRAYGPCTFVWISPLPANAKLQARLERFVTQEPGIASSRILDGHKTKMLSVAGQIRREWRDNTEPVIAVGFTAPFYVATIARGPYVWCPNGIPEDEALLSGGRAGSASAAMQWMIQRSLRRPGLVVTVSEPMSQLVRDRYGSALDEGTEVFTAPNCVDLQTFLFDGLYERDCAVYSGWGQPWQNLSHLARVWAELAAGDPALRFRVISADPRTRVLVERLPADRTDILSTTVFSTVAEHLRAGRLAFLIREDILTNRVSYPTKFGEYMAAGIPVVTTDMQWDVSTLVRLTGCGLLLDPRGSPAQHAARIMAYQERTPYSEEVLRRCHDAARRLDRALWVDRLAEKLTRLTAGGPSATPPDRLRSH